MVMLCMVQNTGSAWFRIQALCALHDSLRCGMLAGDSGQSGGAGGQSAGHVV